MADEAIVQALHQELFSVPETRVYALIDGASVEGLRDALYEHEPEHECLYFGQLAPDMAEVVPYLVWLQPDAPFTQWVLEKGWGGHWGIFAASYEGLRTLRQHFRCFTKVRGPDGKRFLFRFYDPRVLRTFLPTCTPEEAEEFFGPVLFFVAEDAEPQRLLRFWHRPEGMRREEVSLTTP